LQYPERIFLFQLEKVSSDRGGTFSKLGIEIFPSKALFRKIRGKTDPILGRATKILEEF
jgi:hypothetical protein